MTIRFKHCLYSVKSNGFRDFRDSYYINTIKKICVFLENGFSSSHLIKK